MSIRKQLQYLFVLVGILPLLLSSSIAYFSSKTGLSDNLGQSMAERAFFEANVLEKSIEDHLAKLETWANFESFIIAAELAEDDGDRSVHHMLKGLKRNYKSDGDIHLYAIDGETVTRIAVSDDLYLNAPVPDVVHALFKKLKTDKTSTTILVGTPNEDKEKAYLNLDMASAIMADDALVGILAWKNQYPLGDVQKLAHFSILLDREGNIVAFPGFFSDAVHQDFWKVFTKQAWNTFLEEETKDFGYFLTKINKVPYLASFGRDHIGDQQSHWTLMIWQEADVALASVHKLSNLLLFIIVVTSIVTLISGYYVAKKISDPILEITETMNLMSRGEYPKIPFEDQKDEIGQMANALSVFKLNALQKSRMEEEAEKLKARQEQEKKETIRNLAQRFEKRVKNIISTVASASSELATTAKQMSDSIYRSTRMTEEATTNASETSEQVQSVADAAQMMSASIREISEQVLKSQGLVTDSVQKGQVAGNKADSLKAASKKVEGVLKMILDVASKINLLALNATIESARAGEAGKGFAVVANEVKGLAGQTNAAILEIKSVMDEMGAASEEIISALVGIQDSVNKISDASGSIATAVEEQAATTDQISISMQSASGGTDQISDNLKSVSKTATEANASSGHVLSAAEELSIQSEELQRQVTEFLSELRMG